MTAEQIAASIREEAVRLRARADELELIARELAPARRGRPKRAPKRAPDLGDRYAEAVAEQPKPADELKPRRRRRRRVAAKPAATLHVTTAGTPESELEGREVAYTTEEPAA